MSDVEDWNLLSNFSRISSKLRLVISDNKETQNELEKVMRVRDDLLSRIQELEGELMEKYEEEDVKDQELDALRKEVE